MTIDEAKAEVIAWRKKYPYASDALPIDALLVLIKGPQEVTTPVLRPVEERVRPYSPETSWEAAAGVSQDSADSLYNAIYQTLLQFPRGLTNEQLEDYFIDVKHVIWSRAGIRSRCSELVEAGWVYFTGETRPTAKGGNAQVRAARAEFDGE